MFKIDLKRSAEPGVVVTGPGADLQALVRPFAPLVGILVGLLVVFWAIDRWLDRSIRDQEAQVATLESSLAASKQQLAEMSGRSRVLYETLRSEVYWSDQLRLLSEKLPDKIWLTQVRVTSTQTTKSDKGDVVTPGGVVVEGGVLSNSNEGNLDIIGKFMQDLQADARFQESFSSVNLESVQRAADPYALTFKLKISLKS